MYCNKCGQELREGARFCPRCGSRFVYTDNRIPHAENISQEPDGYRGDRNSAPVKKHDTGKKSKCVVFLIVGICAAAAIFAGVMIFLSLNSGTTPQKVYKKYFKALEQDRDKVVSFEQDKGVNGVAVTDINGTGIADVLYMTDSSDGIYLHTLTDSDTDIETDNDISGAVMGSETIFRTSDDDSIYILNDDGIIKTSCAEDNNGNMVTTTRILAQRTTDDESGDYVYMILADSGYLETADKEEYDKFIEDIRSKNVTVIITTLTDDQLTDLFPAVDDNISVSCDDALKKLKDNDIAPVGAGETSDTDSTEEIINTKNVLVLTDNENNHAGEFTKVSEDTEFKSWDDFVAEHPDIVGRNYGEDYSDKMHITIFCLNDSKGNVIEKKGFLNSTGFDTDPCGWHNKFGEFDYINYENEKYEDEEFNLLYNDEYYTGNAECYVINARLREYITLGTYEQDNDQSNGKEPIEWLVLTQDDEKMFVVSKYCLDYLLYPEDWGSDVVWETSYLRNYLNSDFIDDTFSAEEQEQILLSENENYASEELYSTVDGNITEDRVFLMSVDEVNKYLPNNTSKESSKAAYGTEYLYSVMRDHGQSATDDTELSWALRADTDTDRNPEKFGMPREVNVGYSKIFVSITTGGLKDPTGPHDCIRPAMWIKTR